MFTDKSLIVRRLGRQPYQKVWQAMRDFTDTRQLDTPDEIWLVEHDPVFTQGVAGKAEHILQSSNIPVIQTDRGGQVTYHGPGQLVVYPLLNLKRLRLDIRSLVSRLEQSVQSMLQDYGIQAVADPTAPGVYVEQQKVASVGLRVRKYCSFHGLALNVNMDLTPFQLINPCGYAGLKMTQTSSLGGPVSVAEATQAWLPIFCEQLNKNHLIESKEFINNE